jgi:hypothetical protein
LRQECQVLHVFVVDFRNVPSMPAISTSDRFNLDRRSYYCEQTGDGDSVVILSLLAGVGELLNDASERTQPRAQRAHLAQILKTVVTRLKRVRRQVSTSRIPPTEVSAGSGSGGITSGIEKKDVLSRVDPASRDFHNQGGVNEGDRN